MGPRWGINGIDESAEHFALKKERFLVLDNDPVAKKDLFPKIVLIRRAKNWAVPRGKFEIGGFIYKSVT